jgi:acyl phosphate:glycerol-3-phosphate acyltransferase
MPEITPKLLVIPVAAYFVGSIPFGLVLARMFGKVDIRQAGSGNIGATNVTRVVGPGAGVLTLLLDASKGAIAVILAERMTSFSALWMMTAAIAALIGHCFPVWLKFRGGKGVATAAGVFAVLSPIALGGALLLFVIVLAWFRFASLASISAAAAMPLLIYFLWAPGFAPPGVVNFGTLAITLLIIYKHDANIQRLVQGDEPKFSFSKKDAG